MKPTKCSFDGCDKPQKARGLCGGHWQQNRKGWTLPPPSTNPPAWGPNESETKMDMDEVRA